MFTDVCVSSASGCCLFLNAEQDPAVFHVPAAGGGTRRSGRRVPTHQNKSENSPIESKKIRH